MDSRLKVVYMGTPEFAVPPLEALADKGYDVLFAVTQPDSRRGRGKKFRPTPVKEAAEKAGIKVLQPAKLRDNQEFIDSLRDAAPDIIIVAAYGKILPPEVLMIPRLGCVNIHASLLPRFRGAAPIQRSIMAGDEKTGVTLMYMEEGLDTGDMIAKAETEIAHKSAGTLTEELSALGADLLVKYLPEIADGRVSAEKQDDSLATYAPMIKKAEGRLDFSQDAAVLDRLVRGMNPDPGAFTEYGGSRMKVLEAEAVGEDAGGEPGRVISADEAGIDVSCGKGALRITRLQMPGKRAMNTADFLRGHSIAAGEKLG